MSSKVYLNEVADLKATIYLILIYCVDFIYSIHIENTKFTMSRYFCFLPEGREVLCVYIYVYILLINSSALNCTIHSNIWTNRITLHLMTEMNTYCLKQSNVIF